jgi:hypothetical protein
MSGRTSRTSEQAIQAMTPLRLLQMSLESNDLPPLAERALDDLIQGGQVGSVFELLASPPEGAASVAEAVLATLTSPETLKAMLSQDRVDLAGLDAILPKLSAESHGPLLDAIGSSPNRAVRRRLLDRLAQTPVDIGPLIVARLKDDRWYVQRNMLMLLERTGHVPAGFSPHAWTMHSDPRVRTEAIRLQLSLPGERELALRTSLEDGDPRIVRLGLAAIPQECSPNLVHRVIALAGDSALGQEIRFLAVTTLGRLRYDAARDALLRLADGGRSILRRPRLPPKTPVLLAVLRALHENWGDDPRAARVIAMAARSSDPEVRLAVTSPPA